MNRIADVLLPLLAADQDQPGAHTRRMAHNGSGKAWIGLKDHRSYRDSFRNAWSWQTSRLTRYDLRNMEVPWYGNTVAKELVLALIGMLLQQARMADYGIHLHTEHEAGRI